MKQLFSPLFRSFSGIPRVVWLLSGVSLINRTGTMVVCFLTLYLTQRLGFDLRSAGYVLVFYGVGTMAGLYTGGWLYAGHCGVWLQHFMARFNEYECRYFRWFLVFGA